MYLIELVSALLSPQRQLTREELRMLRRVSAGGLAKINADLIQGIPIERTLQMMLHVFIGMHRQQRALTEELPAEARLVISHLDRSVNTAELVFLKECCQSGVIAQMIDEHGRLTPDIDLETKAIWYLYNGMLEDGQCLSSTTNFDVAPCGLIALSAPTEFTSLAFLQPRAGRMLLGISPVVSWFTTQPNPHSIEISSDAANLLLSQLHTHAQNWGIADDHDTESSIPTTTNNFHSTELVKPTQTASVASKKHKNVRFVPTQKTSTLRSGSSPVTLLSPKTAATSEDSPNDPRELLKLLPQAGAARLTYYYPSVPLFRQRLWSLVSTVLSIVPLHEFVLKLW